MDYKLLPQSQINQIEARVTDILRSVYGSTETIPLPVSVVKIINQYELQLKTGVFKDKTISGMYDKANNAIYIAVDEPAPRQVFTIAHELGHFFLHEEKEADVYHRKQQFQLNEENHTQEKEANWFAASLLMPEKAIKHYWNLTKDQEKLAVVFGVSVSAVYYRLKNLGLIE